MVASLLTVVLCAQAPRLTKPVSLHAVTSNGALVDFETDVPTDAQVELRCAIQSPSSASPEPAADAVARDSASTHHLLTVTGSRVPANHLCRYTVRFGNIAGPSGSFWTAPAASSRAPFLFAVVGDSRDHAVWAHVARSVLAKHPRFALTTGDASNTGNNAADWRDYYQSAAELFANTPVFSVRGNHDLGPLYAQLNPQPVGGMAPSVYTFTYGNAAFLALDTNRDDAEQAAFAQRALAAPTGGPLFVFHHHPLYSCGGHGSEPSLQKQFQGLFEHARVTIDVAGHDHDLILWKPINGVHYAVSGGGGSPLYPINACEGPFARRSYGFMLVNVEGSSVGVGVFDEDGAELYRAEPIQAAGPPAAAPERGSP